MKFGTYMLALVEPLIAKIFMALGFSIVSVVGVDVALTQIKGLIASNVASAGPILDFAMYIWIGKGIGIIFGACATKLMLWQIQNATKFLAKSPG